ncbi:MAG: helix-turn-helix domain-containing protein [Pseudonocardiales bacterium]
MKKPETFGEYVTAAREQKNISTKKLAKQLGKHTTTLGRVESGFIAVPTPDFFMDLVDALNLDIVTAMNLLEPYRRIYDGVANATRTQVGDDGKPQEPREA